jgi:A/G-specific adenine glycosylase
LIVRTRAGDLLLERRPPAGVWGGLWSFPECDARDGIAAWCAGRLGPLAGATLEFRDPRRHTFSHFYLDYTPVVVAVRDRPDAVGDDGRCVWLRPHEAPPGGLAAPVAQLIRELTAEKAGGPNEPGRTVREAEP